MTDRWTDRIVGDRMAVDQQFTDRIADSEFSRQQWGLVMTAVEFDVEHPDDEEAARLIADTSKLPSVIPELDAVDRQGPMGGAGGSSRREGGDGSGLLGSITDALGLGGGTGSDESAVDADRLEAADQLAQEYATRLQQHLEDKGKWADVRSAASTDQ